MNRRSELVVLVRGSTINLVGGLLTAAAGFASIFLLTRIIPDIADFGAFLTAVAAVTLGARLAELGAATGLVRGISRACGDRRPEAVPALLTVAAVPALVLAVSMGVAVVLGADVLAGLVADPAEATQTAVHLRLFGWFLPALTALGIGSAAVRGFGSMLPSTIAENIVRPTGQVAWLAVLAAVGSASATAAGYAYWTPVAVAAAAITVVLVVETRKRMPGLPPTPPGRALAAGYWRFTAPRAMSGLFTTVVEWSDTLLLAALAGTGAAGIYTASVRFLVLGRTVQYAATKALLPQISRLLANDDRAGAASTFQAAAAWSVGLTWPWFVFVLVFAEPLLAAMGPDFVEGATAVRILAAAWMLGTALGPSEAVLLMIGRSTWNLYDVIAAVSVNVTLNLLLIPRLGITGAALAWLASIVVNNVLPAVQVHRLTGLLPFGALAARLGFAALASGGIVGLATRTTLGDGLAAAATGGALGLAVYLVLLRRLGVLSDARTMLAGSLRRAGGEHGDRGTGDPVAAAAGTAP